MAKLTGLLVAPGGLVTLRGHSHSSGMVQVWCLLFPPGAELHQAWAVFLQGNWEAGGALRRRARWGGTGFPEEQPRVPSHRLTNSSPSPLQSVFLASLRRTEPPGHSAPTGTHLLMCSLARTLDTLRRGEFSPTPAPAVTTLVIQCSHRHILESPFGHQRSERHLTHEAPVHPGPTITSEESRDSVNDYSGHKASSVSDVNSDIAAPVGLDGWSENAVQVACGCGLGRLKAHSVSSPAESDRHGIGHQALAIGNEGTRRLGSAPVARATRRALCAPGPAALGVPHLLGRGTFQISRPQRCAVSDWEPPRPPLPRADMKGNRAERSDMEPEEVHLGARAVKAAGDERMSAFLCRTRCPSGWFPGIATAGSIAKLHQGTQRSGFVGSGLRRSLTSAKIPLYTLLLPRSPSRMVKYCRKVPVQLQNGSGSLISLPAT
ncbi:PREDICTED: uncharacterized protein LOC102014151 [Chinchilla lanigera]|uniref:uncharacterized protein LOC102014151 n=1 Tax=Chinchilla lanigera TaxID=34839 RepID=UPI000697E118|nr:PREDICTED: uncharacterized protein LOC102014151 [Chinchilla lanigera]